MMKNHFSMLIILQKSMLIRVKHEPTYRFIRVIKLRKRERERDYIEQVDRKETMEMDACLSIPDSQTTLFLG